MMNKINWVVFIINSAIAGMIVYLNFTYLNWYFMLISFFMGYTLDAAINQIYKNHKSER